jgi:hypothetical protein
MLACKLKTLTAAGAVGLLLAVGSTGASAQSAYCDGVARDYASRHAHGGEVIGGAIGGAVTGAIIGGIVGGKRGAGTGAAIGGGVGAVGGAANQSQRWQSLYHHAYNDCMAQNVPGSGAGLRQPGAVDRRMVRLLPLEVPLVQSANRHVPGLFGEYRPCR